MKKSVVCIMSFMLLLVTLLNSSCTKEEEGVPNIVSISITKAPNRVNYIEGAILDLSGLEISLMYSDDSNMIIVFDDFVTNGIKCSIPNGVELSIETDAIVFTHTKSGKKITLNIVVSERVLSELSIKAPLGKTEYTAGENLNFYGLVLNLLMNDGKSIDVPFSSFPSYGIECSISVDYNLTIDDKIVRFVHTKSSKAVEQPITVNPVITNEPIFGTMTDSRDGITYKTVTLGKQTWMAENLRYIGSIPFKKTAKAWQAITYKDRACAYFKYDKEYAEEHSYGVMYSWQAAMIAPPDGWHLPTEDEWNELETFLVDNAYQYAQEAYKMDIAKSMASKFGWRESDDVGDVGNSPLTNNRSGFNAKPSGSISHYDGKSISDVIYAWWWTSSSHRIAGAEGRRMHYGSSNLFRMDYDMFNGFAIRCVKD